MSVPPRKSSRSATLPEDSVRRGRERPARAMVRRGPPSNRYRYRRSPRRRLRPVNFRRGRWEFWETRRLASAPPPLPHPWLQGAAPAAGRGPGLPANGSRSLPQGAAAPSRFLGERQVPRTGNRKDKAGQTERGSRRELTQWSPFFLLIFFPQDLEGAGDAPRDAFPSSS